MVFMKKEKINKFRINLGKIGREERDKIFIEVEYNSIMLQINGGIKNE